MGNADRNRVVVGTGTAGGGGLAAMAVNLDAAANLNADLRHHGALPAAGVQR